MLQRHFDDETRLAVRDNKPTDMQLRAADDVILFDSKLPNWEAIVISLRRTGRYSPTHRSVLRISVDSSDGAVIQKWRDKVAALRTVT